MRPTFLGTRSIPWFSIGTIDATAAEADANTLDVDERNFQSVKDLANVVWFYVPPGISVLDVRFLLTTNSADVDIEIWTGKLGKNPNLKPDEDCDLQRKATLDVICGAQDVHGTSKHYADTAAATNDLTMKAIVTKTAADHMAILEWDLTGENIVIFHGFGTFDEACEVEVTGYS